MGIGILAPLTLLVVAVAPRREGSDGDGGAITAKWSRAPRGAVPWDSLGYVSSYEVLAELPHDPGSFTQGLAFSDDGTLYESDGLYGHSLVRSVEPSTGATVRLARNARNFFAEGIEIVDDKLVQLSWQEKLVNEFDKDTLALVRSVPLNVGREGWGLAYNGSALFLTDSGSGLFVLEPHTYNLLHVLPIVDPRLDAHKGGKLIHGVNELEWVGNELWGNVYPMYQGKHSECIVRIDPSTGLVLGWVDMHGLLDRQRPAVRQQPHHYVLNGIAYDRRREKLYVTGKQWDKMYQVAITPTKGLGPQHVLDVCSLG